MAKVRKFEGYKVEAFNLLKKYEASPVMKTHKDTKDEFETFLKIPTRDFISLGAPFAEEILGNEIETQTWILSVIKKNDFGRGGIHHHYWGAFYPAAKKRTDSPQLFVILHPDKIRFGFGFGSGSENEKLRLKSTLRSSSIWTPDYVESLKSIGIKLRIWDTKGKVNKYEDEIEEQVLFDALEENSLAPNFEVTFSAAEAVKQGADIGRKLEEVFKILLPLYILSTTDHPETLLKKWETKFYNEDEVESDTSILRKEYSWKQFLTDLNWSETTEEAKSILSCMDGKVDGTQVGPQQVIFFGPPGTGKTRAATKLAELLATTKKAHIRTIQFHQSYGYEQFIEGIRPKLIGGQLSYEIKDGVFTEFCRIASTKPREQFVFVIDEINRGNLSKIFGELMFLLEYREQSLNLLYSQSAFSIPSNVIVLGTMNSADRSIALVDYALRRRFRFIEMKPQANVLRQAYAGGNAEIEQCIRFFEALNTKVGDARLAIGHSYLLNLKEKILNKESLRRVWNNAISPLLSEYFLSAPSRLEDFDFNRLWEEAGSQMTGDDRAA